MNFCKNQFKLKIQILVFLLSCFSPLDNTLGKVIQNWIRNIKGEGPWRWSSGRSVRLLLWRSEFKSCWSLNDFSVNLCLKRTEIIKKRPGWPIFRKKHNGWLCWPSRRIFAWKSKVVGSKPTVTVWRQSEKEGRKAKTFSKKIRTVKLIKWENELIKILLFR